MALRASSVVACRLTDSVILLPSSASLRMPSASPEVDSVTDLSDSPKPSSAVSNLTNSRTLS